MTLNIAGNIGKKETCRLCNSENETTEHVFDCTGIDNEDNLNYDCLRTTTDTDTLRKTLELFEQYERKQIEMAEMVKKDGIEVNGQQPSDEGKAVASMSRTNCGGSVEGSGHKQ